MNKADRRARKFINRVRKNMLKVHLDRKSVYTQLCEFDKSRQENIMSDLYRKNWNMELHDLNITEEMFGEYLLWSRLKIKARPILVEGENNDID